MKKKLSEKLQNFWLAIVAVLLVGWGAFYFLEEKPQSQNVAIDYNKTENWVANRADDLLETGEELAEASESFILSANSASLEEEMEDAAEETGEAMEDAADAVEEKADEMMDSGEDMLDDAMDSSEEAVEDAGDEASEEMDNIGE